jgi:flagellar basal body-associated protein FliL
MIALVVLFVGLVGGILTGGIFTIVLIPVGVLALVTAGVLSLWARATQGKEAGETEGGAGDPSSAMDRPLPTGHSNTATAPSSPEQLTDARRQQQ